MPMLSLVAALSLGALSLGALSLGALSLGTLIGGCGDGKPTGDDSAFGVDGTGSAGPLQVDAALDATLTDQCRQVCGTITATGTGAHGLGYQIESDLDGFLGVEGSLDDQGVGSFCLPTGLSAGVHQLAVHLDAGERQYLMLSLDVRPFGWAYGLDKPQAPMAELPWVPSFTAEQLQADPVLVVHPDTWDSVSLLAPSAILYGGQRLVYFGGTADVDFQLGVASGTGPGDLVEYAGNPILTAAETGATKGDWDYYAQNTPEAMVVDGQVWLYYNGRSETAGGLNIGLATSSDGFHFTRVADNPVLAPTGDETDFDGVGVAHPSVLERPVDFADNEALATRVFELWYASGTLQIGYAISADGQHFERYCDGAVFHGQSGTWDQGVTKAPEVAWQDGHYLMTYSGCGQGCYQVGWAGSDDGIRWITAGAPVIPTQPAPAWNSYGTQEAFIEVGDDGTWSFWYAGTGDDHGEIGLLQDRP